MFIAAASLILAATAEAAPLGTAFSYQGRLTQNGSSPTGSYDFQFRLFDAAANGTKIGADVTATAVAVNNGLFNATLDFGSTAFNGSARWLEISVRPNGLAAAYTTLSPRQALPPAPYALFAGNADAVSWNNIKNLPAGFQDGLDSDTTYTAGAGLNLDANNRFTVNFSPNGTSTAAARGDHHHLGQSWSGVVTQGLAVTTAMDSGSGVAGLLGRQGAGSSQRLIVPAGVWGDAKDGHGVLGTTVLVNGAGVMGWHFPTHGSGNGVHGQTASDNGRGVWGVAYSETGVNYGVVGQSASPDGFGGYFVNANDGADTALRAVADGGTVDHIHPSGLYPSAAGEFVGRLGVIGASTAKSVTSYGVLGLTPGISGSGVAGFAQSTNGSNSGVQGQSESTSGRGVYGYANANTGVNYGVYGRSDSPDGFGIYGRVGGTSGLNLPRGAGVFGESSTDSGVVGFSAGNAGVYGESASDQGVLGFSDLADGVAGISRAGRGVYGESNLGAGVSGFSVRGTGVRARSGIGNLIEAYGGADEELRFYVSNGGNVYADGAFHANGADLAEALPLHGDPTSTEPGDVLEFSPVGELNVRKSAAPYSPLVAGVYATRPGLLLRDRADHPDENNLAPVGVVGILPTKVSAENGPIRRGDLLVTSSTSGHAMKGTDRERLHGATLGKALQDFPGPGTARIKVLVNVK
jgi:hypothetical protein